MGGCPGKLGWPSCRPRWDTHLNSWSLLKWNSSLTVTAVRSVRKWRIGQVKTIWLLFTISHKKSHGRMAEYVINCRPLSKSCSEYGLPLLRPIDLMVGTLEPSHKKSCFKPFTASDELRRGHRFSQRITELWGIDGSNCTYTCCRNKRNGGSATEIFRSET